MMNKGNETDNYPNVDRALVREISIDSLGETLKDGNQRQSAAAAFELGVAPTESTPVRSTRPRRLAAGVAEVVVVFVSRKGTDDLPSVKTVEKKLTRRLV